MSESLRKEPKDINDYYSKINAIIIIVNIIIFIFIDLSHSSLNMDWMLRCGAMFWPYVLENGEYYRLITSMFLHFGISHLFNNMLVLWFIGGALESVIGSIKFSFIYFLSGILAGCFSMGYNILGGETPISAGASGAIFGVVGALFYVILINHGNIKGYGKQQIIIFILLSLYNGFASQGVDNMAHIGGFISGFILAILFYRRPKKTTYEEDWRYSSYDEN